MKSLPGTSQIVGAWVCRVSKGEMVEGEGVERRGDGKVKEDEGGLGGMWVGLGAFTHVLPPQFFQSFICR